MATSSSKNGGTISFILKCTKPTETGKKVTVIEYGIDGRFRHLDSTPPDDAKPASVMTLEAEVEVKHQDLLKIRPFFQSVMCIPPDLSDCGQLVMKAFMDCFDKAQNVQEGKLADILFGFEQCQISAIASIAGIMDLRRKGYIILQAPDNTVLSSLPDSLDCWIAYTPKFLRLIYV